MMRSEKDKTSFKFVSSMPQFNLETLVMYITFSRRNIFVSWFKITKYGRFVPQLFMTLRSLGFAEKKISDLAIETFVKSFKFVLVSNNAITNQTILVFRHFGWKLIKGGGMRSNWTLSWLRKALFNALLKENIIISAVVDRSPIPFNGCRAKKLRRKKYKRNRLVKEGFSFD